MASFKIHFLILNHSGPGDAQMSSLFQANLVGNDFAQNPLGKRPRSYELCFVLIAYRDCIRLKTDAEEHGVGRRSLTLARPDVPCWL
jgi:hypothetical protein